MILSSSFNRCSDNNEFFNCGCKFVIQTPCCLMRVCGLDAQIITHTHVFNINSTSFFNKIKKKQAIDRIQTFDFIVVREIKYQLSLFYMIVLFGIFTMVKLV